METLRKFGHNSVVSEKIDNCPWKYINIINMWADIITTISFVGMFVSVYVQNVLSMICFGCVCAINIILGCLLTDSWYSCGVTIKLYYENYGDCAILKKSYQFTENPDYDALEIKTILDEFESYANKIDAENEKWEEEKLKSQKECCNKYKSVIQKVK